MPQTETKRRKKRRHPSGESGQSTDSYSHYIPTPPDGGWGWVIVVSSLVCNIIVDGIGYTFGIFMLEFVDYFKAPKSTVSLVGSLLCGTYLCAGPIVSALTNRYGCRPVAVVGSLISAGAFVLSMFVPTIELLIVTYGVIGGFGFGMIYLPSIVSVGFYFEKKRALATGIAVCGSGVGTFIFAPLSKTLLDVYDWKNALLILAGIILQGAVFGMLMRPLEVEKRRRKRRPRAKNMIDRIKEQAKAKRGKRSESESSTQTYYIRDNNSILERVMEAKLLRQKMIQEDESEIGSLPSMFFVKGVARQNSKDARVHKLSLTLSDKGDIVSYPGSPSSVPRIVLPGNDGLTADSVAQLSVLTDPVPEDQSTVPPEEGTEPSDFATPPTSPVDTSSPDSPVEMLPKQEFQDVASKSRSKLSVSRLSESEGQDKEKTSSRGKLHSNGSIPNGVSQAGQEAQPLIDIPEAKALIIKVHHDGMKEIWQREDVTPSTSTTKNIIRSQPNLGVPKEDYARPMYRKDIFYSGSILHIPEYRSQPDMHSYITSITTIPGFDAVRRDSLIWDNACKCLPKSARDTLREMLDMSLIKDPKFLLLGLGNIFVFLGFYVPFVYLVDMTLQLGIDKNKAAFLLSVIGITNTVGRIVAGWLADLRKINSLVINNVAMLISGVIVILCPVCTTYPLLVVMASIFGLCVAAFISLSSIVLCDLLGLEKLTNAFGLLTLFRGVAAIAGPPLAGFVYEATNNYDASFYLGGSLIIFGASLHFLLHLPCFKSEAPEVFDDTILEIGDLEPAPSTQLQDEATSPI